MLNKFFLLLVVLSCCQCKNDNVVREEARAEVQKAAQAVAATPASSAPGPVTTNQDLAPGQTAPTVMDRLTLAMEHVTTAAGQKACLPITAQGFQDLIGMQFSIRWNPEELTYAAIENIELADLTLQNFGATYAEKGVVVLSWIKLDLQALTLPADAHLFDVCFTPEIASGAKADVRFEPRPTPYEVINSQEQILQFSGINGSISVNEE